MEGSELLNPDAKIDWERLVEKAEDLLDTISMPMCCAVVEFPFDEFKNATIKDILDAIAKQPKNCEEYGKWISAVALLVAYVNTELCRQSDCAGAEGCDNSCE